MIDQFSREINYLRLSVTDLCNLRCKYCMPHEGVDKKTHADILPLETMARIADAAVGLGIKKIRITGGEPLVRHGVIGLVEDIGRMKGKGLRDLAITTNGALLQKYAEPLRKAGLDRVNISIDSLDEEKFREITRCGSLKDVLEGIQAAKEAGLRPIKLNVVLIGGFNDDEIEDFVHLTLADEVEIRFIELMPLGEAGAWDKVHFVPNTEITSRMPQLIPLATKGHGTVARLYKLPGGKGSVGLISPLSSHFCGYCNRIRLTPDGKLKSCLHSAQEIDFRDYGEKRITQFLLAGIESKPYRHGIQNEGFVPVARNMHEIGG